MMGQRAAEKPREWKIAAENVQRHNAGNFTAAFNSWAEVFAMNGVVVDVRRGDRRGKRNLKDLDSLRRGDHRRLAKLKRVAFQPELRRGAGFVLRRLKMNDSLPHFAESFACHEQREQEAGLEMHASLACAGNLVDEIRSPQPSIYPAGVRSTGFSVGQVF